MELICRITTRRVIKTDVIFVDVQIQVFCFPNYSNVGNRSYTEAPPRDAFDFVIRRAFGLILLNDCHRLQLTWEYVVLVLEKNRKQATYNSSGI